MNDKHEKAKKVNIEHTSRSDSDDAMEERRKIFGEDETPKS